MKKLVLLLVFLPLAQAQIIGVGTHRKIYTAALPQTCTPVSGYAYCRVLTIDHTQVGGSTLTNFPVVTQNGSTAMTLGTSRIRNSNCYDVVFTSDSGGTTLVPWEVESCTQGTGAVIAWVLCPACSSSADTGLYVSYGNASISSAQNTGANGPTHVWDSNYGPVYHLGSLSLADSTSGGVTATNSGATSGPGEIDGAAVFNAATAHLTGHQWAAYSMFTLAYWVNWSSVSGYQYMVSDSNGYGSGLVSLLYNSPQIRTYTTTTAGTNLAIGATTVAAGAWYHIAIVYDGTHVTTYVNGVQDSQYLATGTISFTAGNPERIGSNPVVVGGGVDVDTEGTIDEYEFSTTARSLGWITSQYNNQKGGSTFLRVGAEI
jgi:hypothetical protein